MKRLLLSLAFFLAGNALAAVAPPPPGTDIWLVDLDLAEGRPSAMNPRNLTARRGYDNQPAFVNPQAFLFTSMDASGQTDAWRYELMDGSAAPVLVTPESEYSPTPAPDGGISVVRVSLTGVQQLWTLAPGAARYEVLFPMLEGVGYHIWVDNERAALFLVREPPELHVANRRTGEVVVLAKDIGRSLQMTPGASATLAFTEPGQDGKRWIKQLDLAEKRLTSLAPLLKDSEDFVFLPDGRAVMAEGRGLYVWNGDAWQEFARFDTLPGAITRLAISPDAAHLAMVVAEGE
ncbi:MAG TPA: hypothetical protein VF267_01440 [Gammaproteobacteria bacterium]